MKRNSLLTILTALSIAIFLLLSKRPNNLLTDSFTLRKLVYNSSTKLMGDYEAPFHCSDHWTRIPGEYHVYLHFEHLLERHKQQLGSSVDFNSAIIDAYPETPYYGTYYRAKLDDAGVAAIREDVGVDMVECYYHPYLIE